jgi:hypothetical protein
MLVPSVTLTPNSMSQKCVACGMVVPEPERPVPTKGGDVTPPQAEPTSCPNCGKEGTLEQYEEPQGDEDEE